MVCSRCRSIVAISATAVLCLGLTSQAYANVQTSQETTQSITEEVAAAADNAAADKPEASTKTTIVKDGTAFEAHLEDATVKVPEDASKGVTASRTSGAAASTSITVGIGGDKEQAGKLASNGSVVYNGETTGRTVHATKDGVRISNIIRSADAPNEYVHKLTLPNGAKVMRASEYQLSGEDAENSKAASAQTTNATGESADPIVVVDKNNMLIAGIGEAWAKDANGKDVPTNYEIKDGSLIQKVDHNQPGVQYPVVADPYLWIDLIDSAEWLQRDEGWTLSVTPTLWARANAPGYLIGVWGWNELYDKYKDVGRGINTNIGGLRDQYICHQQFAFFKDRWNLDEWRPDVSYPATVAAGCNPD